MGQELPSGENLDWIFEQIAEKNDEEAIISARKIINTAPDRELRTELIKIVTRYQQSEDSLGMHEAMEELVEYTKRQYSLILIQGFRMGQGYQQKISNEVFKEFLEKAANSAQSPSDQESIPPAEEQ